MIVRARVVVTMDGAPINNGAVAVSGDQIGRASCRERGGTAEEDGIRDGHVTGVQTCALPISASFAKTTADTVTRTMIPLLCQEPCNLLVAACRKVVKGE